MHPFKHSFLVKEDTLFMDGEAVDVPRTLILMGLVVDGYPPHPVIPITEETALRILRLQLFQDFLETLEENDASPGPNDHREVQRSLDLLRGVGQPLPSRSQTHDN